MKKESKNFKRSLNAVISSLHATWELRKMPCLFIDQLWLQDLHAAPIQILWMIHIMGHLIFECCDRASKPICTKSCSRLCKVILTLNPFKEKDSLFLWLSQRRTFVFMLLGNKFQSCFYVSLLNMLSEHPAFRSVLKDLGPLISLNCTINLLLV